MVVFIIKNLKLMCLVFRSISERDKYIGTFLYISISNKNIQIKIFQIKKLIMRVE